MKPSEALQKHRLSIQQAAVAEDANDLEAFTIRENEPLLSFEDVLKDLKTRGKL